eukprot:gene13823-18537_t
MEGKSAKLLDLPEYLFHQLMEWLTLDEFSLLDCSFCCHDKRDLILNSISSSTIHLPLTHYDPPSFYNKKVTTRGQLSSYWSWLQTRRIFFEDVRLLSSKEAFLFTKFYIYPLTKKYADILGQTMKSFSIYHLNKDVINSDSIFMTVKLFNCLELFSCDNCLISDSILNSILSYSTKLYTIDFSNLPHITDDGLSSILATCHLTINVLFIQNCQGISGTNISPLLLTNLSQLRYYGDSLEGLPSMSLGLTGLEQLSLGGIDTSLSDYSYRETLINLKSITEIEVYDSFSFSGVNLRDAISPFLEDLILKNCENLTYEGLCDILSNNLTNLISLELTFLPLDVENEEIGHLPPLPSSLISLNLSNMLTITDKELNELFANYLPVLDTLKMSEMDMVTGNEFTFHLPSSMSSLIILLSHLSDVGLKHLFSNKLEHLSEVRIKCPKITGEGFTEISAENIFSFDLSNCGITSKGLCDILSNDWPDLDTLDLSYCKIIDCGELFRFSTSNLSCLHLDDNSDMTEDGLYHLFLDNNLVNLTFLSLKNLSNITNLALQPTLPKSLVQLYIGMKNLTDLGLRQLLSNNLKKLSILDVSACEAITLTDVILKSLKYLNLTSCRSLTCKGLFDLLMNCSSHLREINISNSGVDKSASKSVIPGIVKFILCVTAPKATLSTFYGGTDELFDF